MATSKEKRVSMAYSSLLIQTANSHPKFTGRATLISSLIQAYDLHKYIKIIFPQPSPYKELTLFHSSDYITYIQTHSTESSTRSSNTVTTYNRKNYTDDHIHNDDENDSDEYGLSYDCPIFPNLYNYISIITGATVTMVHALVNGETDIGINWYGGWHHGQKDAASGFCYCNDIVIGILYLLKHYERVLYIDIDIHHGDGVQNAFNYSSKVLTLSFHKHSPGFYPGTGSVDDIGSGRGQYYSLNVPLWDGINDEQYVHIFKSIVGQVYERYKPQVLVLQCGADCLSGDPLGGFNLSIQCIGQCVQEILSWNIPTLLLGGGGYNFPNTARLWTYLTSLTVNQELPLDIPDHEYFTCYSPDYQLSVDISNCKSCATESQITSLIETLTSSIQHISS